MPSSRARASPAMPMGGNPGPCQPCHAVLSRPKKPFHACEQFATPLLLLEFSPGDLGAPSVFGLSVFLFKVALPWPPPPNPPPPSPSPLPPSPRRPARRHRHRRPPSHVRCGEAPHCRSLIPSWQFVFGPMCGSWMDSAPRWLVMRWGIGLQCAGVSLALCTYAAQASNSRLADPR